MKVTYERSAGKAQKMGGTIKKTVGKIIGSERLEAEGRVAELEGIAKQDTGKAGERMIGAIQEIAGTAQNKVGQLLDNEKMKVEGTLAEIKGQARQDANQKVH